MMMMTMKIIMMITTMIVITTMTIIDRLKILVISNSNWTEWSTIQGVIGRVISKF